MLFMPSILYKPLAIWPPGHDKSLFNKIEIEIADEDNMFSNDNVLLIT